MEILGRKDVILDVASTFMPRVVCGLSLPEHLVLSVTILKGAF